MPAAYNIEAFKAVCENNAASGLIRAYCGLMVIELGVKDVLNCHALKHDVQRMLQRLGQDHAPAQKNRAALTAQTSQLSNLLSALPCQSIANTPTKVRPTAFPDVRYLRHENDWHTDNCSNAEIETLRRHVDALRHFLRKKCLIGAVA